MFVSPDRAFLVLRNILSTRQLPVSCYICRSIDALASSRAFNLQIIVRRRQIKSTVRKDRKRIRIQWRGPATMQDRPREYSSLLLAVYICRFIRDDTHACCCQASNMHHHVSF
ncbi:hypothetical protein BS78_01G059800 [Paspalum vaginatum]|nr:hypothetical protein BS78_01G059800 [Paspalum vaginatum]